MKHKIARLLSVLLALILSLSVFPVGVLAETIGGAGGDNFTDSGCAGESIGTGDAFINSSPSGVRIYLSSDRLVNANRYTDSSGTKQDSSNGNYIIYGGNSVVATLDLYKSLALYEISDWGNGSTSMVGRIFSGSKTLSARVKNKSGNEQTVKAFCLSYKNHNDNAWNTAPNFAELFVGTSKEKSNPGYTPWFKDSSGYKYTFDSLSKWADTMFGDANSKDLTQFLRNYRSQLKSKLTKEYSSVLSGDKLEKTVNALVDIIPDNYSDFINKQFCIVVEPVMITGIENSAKETYYAWSAQDFYDGLKLGSKFRSTSDAGYFGKIAFNLRRGFYIDYKSDKYNKGTPYSSWVSTNPDRYNPFNRTGNSSITQNITYNPAGGYAYFYSSDVVAQDVPVQVANTVVVDVGAPKYINGSGSATGGYLASSGTLGVAVVNR